MPQETDAPTGPTAQCGFMNKATGNVDMLPVAIPTTADSAMAALRNACQDVCRQDGYPGWCQPYQPDRGDMKWLVFSMQHDVAMLDRAFPTSDAAAMWLMHHHA